MLGARCGVRVRDAWYSVRQRWSRGVATLQFAGYTRTVTRVVALFALLVLAGAPAASLVCAAWCEPGMTSGHHGVPAPASGHAITTDCHGATAGAALRGAPGTRPCDDSALYEAPASAIARRADAAPSSASPAPTAIAAELAATPSERLTLPGLGFTRPFRPATPPLVLRI